MLKFIVPFIFFSILAAVLAFGLFRDPRLVPSPLIGHSVPQFNLPSLKKPARHLTHTDLKGQILLLNVWATWCAGCYAEHGILMEIAKKAGIPLIGLNYKDNRQEALQWLTEHGDPYENIIYDPEGLLALDLGVYGAPETFVLDENGIISYKHIGPITIEHWKESLLPILKHLATK